MLRFSENMLIRKWRLTTYDFDRKLKFTKESYRFHCNEGPQTDTAVNFKTHTLSLFAESNQKTFLKRDKFRIFCTCRVGLNQRIRSIIVNFEKRNQHSWIILSWRFLRCFMRNSLRSEQSRNGVIPQRLIWSYSRELKNNWIVIKKLIQLRIINNWSSNRQRKLSLAG